MTSAERDMLDSLAMGYDQLTGTATPATLELDVIPLPRHAVALPEPVTWNGRIVCVSSGLEERAELFQSELKCFSQLDSEIASLPVRPGDLVLEVDASIRGYRLDVDGANVRLRAGSQDELSFGTSTVLQLLTPGNPRLAGMSVADEADSSYRGVMLDLGRSPHTKATLKQMILLCKFYKLNYLHLHLSDTELDSFASEAYPELTTPGATLSRNDWIELEDFSGRCGVTLLPELDFPGHSQLFLSRLPQLRCDPPHPNTICVSRPESFQVIETLLAEICGVFRRTPYVHIGADEAELDGWKQCAFCREEMRRHGWDDPRELYRNFIVRLNAIVKSHGKRTIVWEGFAPEGRVEIPRDITVMVFESLYHLPGDLTAAGYDVINTSWQPLYLEGTEIHWPICHIFNWHKYRWENWFEQSAAHPSGLEVPPTPRILGAGLCSWGVPDRDEIRLLHFRMSALAERLWNPDSRNFRHYQRRLGALYQRVENQYLNLNEERKHEDE